MADSPTDTPRSPLAPPRAVAFLFGAYLVGLIVFAAARLVFLLHFPHEVRAAGLGPLLLAFAVGLRFDTVVIAAVLLPLVAGLPFLMRRPRFGLAIIYLVAVCSVLFLLLLGDIRFFEEFDNHLNFHVIDYLTEGRTAWNLVLFDSSFWSLTGVWVALAGLLTLGLLVVRRLVRPLPLVRRWPVATGYTVLLVLLAALGIRGRVDLAPIDWGVAYFSHNHFINQLALNGVYTLGRTATEHDGRLSALRPPDRWEFTEFSEAIDTVRAMLDLPGDTWLEPGRSLRRTTHQPEPKFGFRPNIVLVLMESFSGRNTGVLGSPENLTPCFDSLARRGILFSNFFATGTRTSYGIAGAIGSFPSVPGRSILKRYEARHPFVMLSEILRRRGYVNAFIYGGDLVFDNMGGFLRTKAYDRILGEEDLGRERSFSKWGIPDHLLLRSALELADTLPRPFQLTILTLSNHSPFELPDSSVRRYQGDDRLSRIYNAQIYADWAIGRFMAEAADRPVFDSTIFVFTADHALWGVASNSLSPVNLHIPLLIYGPALLGDSGRTIATYSGQCDLLPTLMGLLGGDYTHESWGRDILRVPPADSGFAIFNSSYRIGYLVPDFFLLEHLGGKPGLFDPDFLGQEEAMVNEQYPDVLRRLQRRLHYYLQAAEQATLPEAQRRGL